MLRLGLDRLSTDERRLVSGRKAALLAHGASLTSDLVPAALALRDRAGADLRLLLAPEHGLYGTAQDMEAVAGGRDPLSGLPVVSLYGASEDSLRPDPAVFGDAQVLVVDLQDVGARYYTFAWTAALCLEAAAEAGLQVLVCDRPNPIGGLLVEGPGLEPDCRSFVGLLDVPVRHGLTIGELLRLYAARRGLDVDLHVIPMEGWHRGESFEETGLAWVPPSPNMPTVETALVYPGLCLVEATSLSEGRGTTTPFLQVGAPGLDPGQCLDALSRFELPGVRFRPAVFRPMFSKHAGETCFGVGIHVTDRQAFRPFRTGLCLLSAALSCWPADRADFWRQAPYEFVSDRPALDLLTGSARARRLLEEGGDPRELGAEWQEREAAFRRERREFLLYGEGA